jgi:N-acetylglutamate synthase-like GNAT family acetyltransferase
MQLTVEIDKPAAGKSDVCEPILRSLPDWFGMERSIVKYLKDMETMPTLIAKANGETAGFLTIKKHNGYSAEVHVMAVRSEMHRSGVGRQLIQSPETVLRRDGIEYLQVKTLGPSMADEHYERTRAFYMAMGFRPLEEFANVWDAENPCLVMVKKL